MIRTIHTNQYSVISTFHALFDMTLSWQAKGLLTNLLLHNTSDDFSIDDLENCASNSKEEFDSTVRELIRAGYISKSIRADGITTFDVYEFPKKQ